MAPLPLALLALAQVASSDGVSETPRGIVICVTQAGEASGLDVSQEVAAALTARIARAGILVKPCHPEQSGDWTVGISISSSSAQVKVFSTHETLLDVAFSTARRQPRAIAQVAAVYAAESMRLAVDELLIKLGLLAPAEASAPSTAPAIVDDTPKVSTPPQPSIARVGIEGLTGLGGAAWAGRLSVTAEHEVWGVGWLVGISAAEWQTRRGEGLRFNQRDFTVRLGATKDLGRLRVALALAPKVMIAKWHGSAPDVRPTTRSYFVPAVEGHANVTLWNSGPWRVDVAAHLGFNASRVRFKFRGEGLARQRYVEVAFGPSLAYAF